MDNSVFFKFNLVSTVLFSICIATPLCAEAMPPLSTDIIEPEGIYFPLSSTPLNVNVTSVLEAGACETDNYSGCTLDDVNADTNPRDDFKPEIKVHIISDTFPDDGKITNATLRQRGNSSRLADQKSYRIKLDSKKKLWRGERKLQLNKHSWDLSRVANHLSFDLMQDIPHLPSLRTDFVHLYVDEVDYGLFTHVENVGKEYLTRRGWPKNSGIYKADHFDFYMSEVYALNEEGKPLDPQGFNSKIKIKRGKDQRKLLEMLSAVNDKNNNFSTEVMGKYFNKNNYLTWLTVNFLFGNQDAVGVDADNFYLLNRQGEDIFYFLPWDYDEAWLETPWDIENNIHQSRAWSGISAYWSSLLHKRYLQQPGALAELTKTVEYIKNKYVTEEIVANKLNAYLPIIQPLVSALPDVDYLPITGNIPAMDEFLANYNNMYTAVQKNHQNFVESIQYPMGFWIKPIKFEKGKLSVEWTPSYDFQGDDISYDIQISTSPDFSSQNIVAEMKHLVTTSYEYSWALPENNNYYLRVLARDSSNPVDHWQVAFNEYEANDREYHGVVLLQEGSPDSICEMGVDPQTIKLGKGTALWWWGEGITEASINSGIGDVEVPMNYKWIYPEKTTVFTMTAKGVNGEEINCQTTITVEPNNKVLPPVCAVGTDPKTIRLGEGTALWWWAQNGVSAKINEGIGSVPLPTEYKWLYPNKTTTYSFVVKGKEGGEVNCDTTVIVN